MIRIFARAKINGMSVNVILKDYKKVEIFEDCGLIAEASYNSKTKKICGNYITISSYKVQTEESFENAELYVEYFEAYKNTSVKEVQTNLVKLAEWICNSHPASA